MIAKEWLEDIKERFAKYQTDYNLNGEDVEWLIQQAEKIELLNAEIETLQAKWEAQGLMIQKLHRENQRYKQALEFYADSENWIPQNDDVLSEITMDYGSKAQQALGWGEENDKHRA